jgi:hypothetical protein
MPALFKMQGDYAATVQDAFRVLAELDVTSELARWAQEERVPVYFNNLLGGTGGFAYLGMVFFPVWMQEGLEPERLAHELTHCQQGLYFFGCLENERGAFIVQKKCELELARRANRDTSAIQQALTLLEQGGQAAYDWIYAQGDIYKTFPPTEPFLWEVDKWLPQVRYVLSHILPASQA